VAKNTILQPQFIEVCEGFSLVAPRAIARAYADDMDAFSSMIFWMWTAAFAVVFVHRRLSKIAAKHYPRGHPVLGFLAVIGLVEMFAWLVAVQDFIAPGWPSLRAWIAVAIYVGLSALTLRALGPRHDAAPLFKKFPPATDADDPAGEPAKTEVEL
jgi:hypothetical protein